MTDIQLVLLGGHFPSNVDQNAYENTQVNQTSGWVWRPFAQPCSSGHPSAPALKPSLGQPGERVQGPPWLPCPFSIIIIKNKTKHKRLQPQNRLHFLDLHRLASWLNHSPVVQTPLQVPTGRGSTGKFGKAKEERLGPLFSLHLTAAHQIHVLNSSPSS